MTTMTVDPSRLCFELLQMIVRRWIAILCALLLAPALSFAQMESGSFEFEGANRDYIVFLPGIYNGIDKLPLMLALHGYTLDAQQHINYSRMNVVADTAGFIVVYPNALYATWNSGIYDSPLAPPNPNVNDVGFIDALIDTLNTRYSIDLDRVYASGFSNGGFMSFRLACELSHRIAAIGSVAGVISHSIESSCDADHKMPVIMINGTLDTTVPYSGAVGFHSVEYTLNRWASFNLCTESDTLSVPDLYQYDGSTVVRMRYRDPSESVSVILYKVINGGHSWPGGDKTQFIWPNLGNTNMDINSSAEIWNFVKYYSLDKLPTIDGVDTCCGDPVEFSVSQNYPNPFNLTSTIFYDLLRHVDVTLTVYDLLGRTVRELASGTKPPGTYEVMFDASGLPSGVYIYRLEAGDFVETKRMVVVK